MDNFDRFQIGDKAEVKHIITESDIQNFATLTGDTNPLHLDDDYAKRTSLKKRVVHGMLSASFISTLIGTKMPGEGALWFSQTTTFLQPVWIGDEIKVIGTIAQKSESQRSFRIKIEIINQHNELVISGESQVNVPKIEENGTKLDLDTEEGVVVIIGGTGGIGENIVMKLGTLRKKIIFTYLKNENLAKSIVSKNEKEIEIESYRLDICNEHDIKTFVKYVIDRYGRIAALVNCATDRIINKSLMELTWDSVKYQLNVHLKSVFILCKEIIPHFVINGGGKIVNITSIYSDATPPLNFYDYVIAKSALSAFTKSLALEFGPKGININIISPSMTETSLIATVPAKVKLISAMQTPLRRLANPDDISSAVVFLIGNESSFITGETIRINGGQLMI